MKILIELEEKNINNMSVDSVSQFFQLIQSMINNDTVSTQSAVSSKKEPISKGRKSKPDNNRTEPVRIDSRIEKEEREEKPEPKPEEMIETIEADTPKDEDIKEVTFEELKKRLMELQKEGKPITQFIVENYKVKKLSDIKPENYIEILEKAEAM